MFIYLTELRLDHVPKFQVSSYKHDKTIGGVRRHYRRTHRGTDGVGGGEGGGYHIIRAFSSKTTGIL